MKVKEKKIAMSQLGRYVFLVLVAIGAVLLIMLPQATTYASGLVETVKDAANLYSRYDLDNYQLDFYVDTSWSWLPWNWMDGIGRSVMYGIYCITEGLWAFSRMISSFTGEVVSEAYNLDIIGELSEQIGKSMQDLAGVSENGVSDGFLKGFLPWILVTMGLYVAYVGLIKRETSKVAGAFVNMFVIGLVTVGLIAFAPDYIANVNEFSSDISKAALKVGTGFVLPGQEANENIDDSVTLIRNNLFSVQVYQPWLILQYGTSDENIIGTSRIENLLSVNPQTEYGSTREAVVIDEINTYANLNMTVIGVVKRLGMVLLIFLVNFVISVVVIMLCGAMLLSQIMFIMFAMVLPISLVIAMFPTMGGIAKSAIMKIFNVIMFRAGITLLVTIAFCVSSLVYGLAGDHSFLMIGYLQIVVFVGIYLKKNEILGMFAMHESGEGDMQRSLFRNYLVTMFAREKLYDMRYNRRAKKREKKRARQQARDDRAVEREERRMDRQPSSAADSSQDAVSGRKSAVDKENGKTGGREQNSRQSSERQNDNSYRAADSSPRMNDARFDLKNRTPDGADTDETDDAVRESGYVASESQKQDTRTASTEEKHMKAASAGEEHMKRTADRREDDRKQKASSTVHAETQAKQPERAEKKLRLQNNDRHRALVERRKNAALSQERVSYQGKQYRGIWADALSKGDPSGQSTEKTVKPMNQSVKSKRSAEALSKDKPAKKNVKSDAPMNKGYDTSARVRESVQREKPEAESGKTQKPKKQTDGQKVENRQRPEQVKKSEPQEQRVAKGMTAGTVQRESGAKERGNDG